MVFLPTFFTKTVGFTLEQWLQLVSLMFLSNIIWNLLFGVIGDRLGWRRTVALCGGVGSAITTLLLYYTPHHYGANFPLAALAGILFVLKSGIPWEMLPQEMGCGCGMTCWRRLRDWQAAGVWERLHRVLLDRLGTANAIDWSRCSIDSASVPAKRGARSPARTRPTAASRAPSATSWSTRTASPSPWS